MKFGQKVWHNEVSNEFEMGHVRSKSRSLGKIVEKPCVHSEGPIFNLITMKLSQNVCDDETTDECENG